jgi:hypothetical protein
MKKDLFFSFILFFVIIFLAFSQIGCDLIDEYQYGLIVKGKITNLNEVYNYQNYYLQLCPVSDKGQAVVSLTEKGVFFKSDLSKLNLNSDGIFKFKEKTIEPGNYFVCMQGFPLDSRFDGWLRLKSTGQLNSFTVKKDQEKNVSVDTNTLYVAEKKK